MPETGHNQEFKNYVKENLAQMERDSYNSQENLLLYNINEAEVKKAIKEMKLRKAPGWDSITGEHVKYGGTKLISCITKLFNLITMYEYVPEHFKKGTIIPIPKGSKCRSKQDNYRGITLLPVLAKLYEKCIVRRVEQWAKESNLFDNLQGAAQENCSSLNTAWLVKETICYNIEKSNNVWVGLLDTKKSI